MSYQTLDVTRDTRGVVSLQLDLPSKRNALSVEMMAELTAFAADVNGDDSVRAVVLSGKGDLFCAGGDLTWMMALIKADRQTRMREARKLAEMLGALNTMRAPLALRI